MPFKSTAQQRFMYSQHPQIARRWSDEMRGGRDASKFQRQHPIKAAGLPRKVGKALEGVEDVWRASVGAAKLRNARTARMVARQASTSETRRAATVANNNLAFRATRNNRFASGTATGRKVSDVDKAFSRQSVAPVLARRNPTATFVRRLPPKPQTSPIGKAIGMGELRRGLHAVRQAPKIAQAGFRQGVTGAAKPRMGLGAATALHGNRGLQAVGQAGRTVGQNRGAIGLSTGIVGGSVMGAGLAHRDVEKAHGDPEDARYYRLGAGSAVAGAAGAGGLGYAVRDAHKTSRIARAGSPMGVQNMRDVQLFVADKDEIKAKRGTRSQVNLRQVEPKAVHRADRLARHGVAITRRGALAGVGGLAALGGANAMRRRAHERRWN